MASLRKRPEAEATDEPAVAISVETDAPPAPVRDDATEALARQIGSLRDSESLRQQAAFAQAAAHRRDAWLNSTPAAKDHLNELNALHHAALDAGLVDTSPQYFQFLEDQLASLPRPAAEAATHMAEEMQQRAAQDRVPEPPPRPSRISYSAPVSRDAPSASGRRPSNSRVTLSPAEQEAARSSNISLEEYAKQKLKLAAMKASGEYGENNRR